MVIWEKERKEKEREREIHNLKCAALYAFLAISFAAFYYGFSFYPRYFADLPMSLPLNAQIYYKVILPSDNAMLSGRKACRENK